MELCNEEQMMLSIPKHVEEFKTNLKLYEYFNLTSSDYNLRSLEIILESDSIQNIEDLSLFKSDLIDNLKHLNLKWEFIDLWNYRYHSLSAEKFKKIKKLQSLKLINLILVDVDTEFNHLTEASFSIQVPENISNFFNLVKLKLENLKEKISLNEQFLEYLVNLEELGLKSVSNSIDLNSE